MSIFKNEHTDGSHSLLLNLLNLLIRRPCQSYLDKPVTQVFNQRHHCIGLRWHRGKHFDGTGLRWAYGEDFFGGRK